MTKQEDIREGIKRIVATWSLSDGNTTRGIDDRMLEYLHSKGVVIKVDISVNNATANKDIPVNKLYSQELVVVEPLI